ncbi:MAG TPA: carboxypeptidase-like regulatory domain-containing protein [Candidatus Acidoferrales bacterium]|nr:carboxypeptidase-like regulatory domain-containing protein [Candidatus Acidoferrales bacterium]
MNRHWISVSLGLLLLLAGAAGPAAAQDKHEQLRTVRGQVIDRQDNPIPSAVVYLKNLHTQTVKTYIADDEGRYRFSGLDPNVNYEIHAEHGDMTSATRTISNFDSRKEIVFTLKVDKKKSGK